MLVHCDPVVLVARVANPDRRERFKWIDPAGVREYVRTHQLVDVSDLDPMIVETSGVEPADAARRILERLDRHSA